MVKRSLLRYYGGICGFEEKHNFEIMALLDKLDQYLIPFLRTPTILKDLREAFKEAFDLMGRIENKHPLNNQDNRRIENLIKKGKLTRDGCGNFQFIDKDFWQLIKDVAKSNNLEK